MTSSAHPDLTLVSSRTTPPRSSDALLELMRELSRAVVGLLVDCARAAGLSQIEYLGLLRIVAAAGMTPADLRPILGISGGSVTELADRLEERKLISRVRSEADRRRVLLRPTTRGRSKVERTIGPVLARLAEIVQALSEDDLIFVGRFLYQVGQGIGESAPNVRPAARRGRARAVSTPPA